MVVAVLPVMVVLVTVTYNTESSGCCSTASGGCGSDSDVQH